VLDAFCGCGTTVAVANRLKRRWIGMDITYQSVALILKRLKDSEGQAAVDAVELHGVPVILIRLTLLFINETTAFAKSLKNGRFSPIRTIAPLSTKRKAQTLALTALPIRANLRRKFCP
jgi:hypothetical protein